MLCCCRPHRRLIAGEIVVKRTSIKKKDSIGKRNIQIFQNQLRRFDAGYLCRVKEAISSIITYPRYLFICKERKTVLFSLCIQGRYDFRAIHHS